MDTMPSHRAKPVREYLIHLSSPYSTDPNPAEHKSVGRRGPARLLRHQSRAGVQTGDADAAVAPQAAAAGRIIHAAFPEGKQPGGGFVGMQQLQKLQGLPLGSLAHRQCSSVRIAAAVLQHRLCGQGGQTIGRSLVNIHSGKVP